MTRLPGGRGRGSAAAAAWLAVAVSPASASAFCRTSACEAGSGAVCEPARPTDCGVPLAWGTRCPRFSLQEGASAEVPLAAARAALTQAFAAWSGADCGGSPPSLEAAVGDDVACDRVEYNLDDGNANVVVFRDEAWPYPDGATLALSTVTYGVDTGTIFDADLELNSAQVEFTTTNEGVQIDLLSVLTHEAGHLLGLAHTPDALATMNAEYTPGTLALRTLEADDVAAVCAAYPPAAPSPSCDSEPPGGFASECGGAAPPPSGCAVAGPLGESPPPCGRFATWLAALGLVTLRATGAARARRARRHPCA